MLLKQIIMSKGFIQRHNSHGQFRCDKVFIFSPTASLDDSQKDIIAYLQDCSNEEQGIVFDRSTQVYEDTSSMLTIIQQLYNE